MLRLLWGNKGLSVLSENVEKLKSSLAINDLINKFAKKKSEETIYLNCLANLAKVLQLLIYIIII